MDEDFFEFEPASEAAPDLVLGKKKKNKKKKKKKKDADATIVTDDPNVKSTKQKEEVSHSDQVIENNNDSNDNNELPTSTFGALALDENDSDQDPISNEETTDVLIVTQDQDEDLNLTASNKKKSKKKKKRGKTQDEDDTDPFEEALKEAQQLNKEEISKPDHEEEVLPEPQDDESEERRSMTPAEKKKAKKEREKQAKKEKAMKEQTELDNLLAELGEPEPNPETADDEEKEETPVESAPMTAAQKKRAKKKKKNAQKNEEEHADARPEETAGPSNVGDDEVQNDSSTPAAGGDVDDLLAELTGAADSSTNKKKAKKKKKKAGKAEDDSTEKAAGSEEPTEPKKTKKKESAVIRRMREEREKRLAEEERLRKLKEEEDARIAEEERKREEEERKIREEKERKKAAEKAKRERKRQEGTLLSKAEKEKRRKAELFRKQMMDMGMVPAASADNSSNSQKERVVYGKRKKQQKQKSDQGETSNASASTDEHATTGESIRNPQEAEKEPEIIPDAWDEHKESAENKKNKTLETQDDQAEDKIEDKEKDKGESESESETDSDDSEYEGMSRTEIAAEKRLDAIRKQRAKQKEQAYAARSPDRLRSPVICILGHVDTGKTKILDRIRRTNVQDGEAGGITQQIGATYFPIDAVKKEATKLKEGKVLKYNVPSLLIIDTPGHESFTNLRSRGSSLCDIAILVVDIMHGLEPQTRESIDLLKLRKTPFIVALNKIDRIYDWNAQPHNCPTRDSLAKQPRHAQEEFARRVKETQLEFSQIGFNTELYWENSDVRKTVSLVPTSAISGEGIPDLLMLLLALPQKLLQERLMFSSILEATVLEVKVIEGLGTTIDIILTGGTIREGDTIMVVGLDGPLVTTIRALLTPHPMKEMRVKGQYLHHKEIVAAQGIKISADGLDKAVAGTQLMVVQNPEDEDEMEFVRKEVMKDFQTILTNVDRSGLGVYVQASTLGSLEALLEFLRTSKIPVSGINIGPVHKRDITKASTMLERRKEFATILAFDVSVEKEARELAEDAGVTIFTADIIYHLFDQFTAYMEDIKQQRKEEASETVVFPSVCKILPQHIYNKRDPIVLGVDVMDGILRVGTPLVVRHGTGWLDIGRVASLELNKKQVMTVRKGESVAIKIQHKNTEHIMYGRHFTFEDTIYSKMSRSSIDLLKTNFRDDLEKTDWALVVKLKRLFNIQ